MKLLIAFLKLIRWPNLFFIALTQFLFYYCIVDSIFKVDSQFNSEWTLLYCLVAASVFIAASGYIINDYFDMQIDNVNKPDRVLVDTIIKRRWAIMWHWIISFLGLCLSAYISFKTSQWSILIINGICVIALWFYSTTFKKKLLSGNIIISLLTAWTIIVIYIFSGASLINLKAAWESSNFTLHNKQLFKYTIIYAGFAFIVSLIREVIKDLEDMHGDAKFDCKTMPIKWGVPASKVFAAVWIIVCIGSLAIIQLYAWQSGLWLSALYVTGTIIIPLLLILKKLKLATIPSDYHTISTYLKLIMLAGILSMLFFKFI